LHLFQLLSELDQELLTFEAKISHHKFTERQTSVHSDSPIAIFYMTGHPKAAILTKFNMSQGLHEHLGQYFTRLCTPIPMFHIFSENTAIFRTSSV
jgi:acyl-CoA synthetase (AMP-forming)/AMP-acid ligase II